MPDEDAPPTEKTAGKKKRRKTKAVTVPKIMAREKQRNALELRKAGASYRQIAREVGYADASGARKAVQAALDQLPQEGASELRVIQVERLNYMLLMLWSRIQNGDDDDQITAINTALRVMERMDALMGTNAAQEVNVHHEGGILVIDGSKDEFIEGLKMLAGVDAEIEAGNMPQLPAGDIIDIDVTDTEEASYAEVVPTFPTEGEDG